MHFVNTWPWYRLQIRAFLQQSFVVPRHLTVNFFERNQAKLVASEQSFQVFHLNVLRDSFPVKHFPKQNAEGINIGRRGGAFCGQNFRAGVNIEVSWPRDALGDFVL